MFKPTPYRRFRRQAISIGIALLTSMGFAFPQDETPYPSATGGTGVGRPRPNVDLPKNIPAPEGQLTLFADFSGPSENKLPLYLVNRTGRDVSFPSQDHVLYIKLEHALEDGGWERAQAHSSSWCGNSYYPVTLLPGHHFQFYGYMPSSGTTAKVRFASYQGSKIISNEGQGFFLPSDVENSRQDPMGRRVSRTLADLLHPKGNARRNSGIPPEHQVVALRLLQASGPNPYYQNVAANLAEDWERKINPSKEEFTAAHAVREILAEPWPKKRSDEALLSLCLDSLANRPTQGGFGLPGNHTAIVWQVLGDLAAFSTVSDPRAWQPVVDLAMTLRTPEDISGIMRVAEVPHLADELLPSSFFETHIFDADLSVQSVCIAALSRRSQLARLTELGWKLNPQAQILVLRALAYPGEREGYQPPSSRNPDYDRNEEKFWRYCLESQPLEASYALQRGTSSEHNPFHRTVHDPLREILAREAARGAASDEDFDLGGGGYQWRMAVEFLASWRLEEDDPLFLKLLEHRGFEKSEVSTGENKRYLRQRFGIREAAKQALLRRGQPIPENLVTERNLPR